MLSALPGLRALDSDGRLLQRLALAFAQTVQMQRPLLLGPERPRAAHTLRAAALQLGAEELAQACEHLERMPASPDQLLNLDALLAAAQRELESA